MASSFGPVSPTANIGGGKESGTSSTVSPYAALAAHIGKQIEKEVDPLRAQFLHMLMQVVSQGGSAVGTPMSNAATSASMQAGSQQQQQTASDLARMTGGTANPVGSAILASQQQQSGQATSQIPTNIGEMLLSLVNPAVSSAQSGVGNMLNIATQGNRTTNYSGSNMTGNLGFGPSPMFGGGPSTTTPVIGTNSPTPVTN